MEEEVSATLKDGLTKIEEEVAMEEEPVVITKEENTNDKLTYVCGKCGKAQFHDVIGYCQECWNENNKLRDSINQLTWAAAATGILLILFVIAAFTIL